MKAITMILLVSLLGLPAVKAQTWAEWFNQKNTQKKYLIEQIAALKAYGSYLSKGYSIARSGLGSIEGFKDGEFGLHRAYFGSLGTVHPAIAGSEKARETMLLEQRATQYLEALSNNCQNSYQLVPTEKRYTKQVCAKFLREVNAALDELEDLTTNGRLQMSDDQRIKRLDLIWEQAKSHYRFARNFHASTMNLISERKAESEQLKQSKMINGIK